MDSQRLRGLRARDRAALSAFAEAVLPEDAGPLPGAGPDGVDAAAAVSRFLAQVPGRQRLVVLAAVRGVEWLSLPRRFSRLSLERRTRRLERLSANALGRDLVLLLKALVSFGWARDERVRAALGIEPGCELAPGATHPLPDVPALRTADLVPPDSDERCDVVVVGSGAGGATAARLLAEAGLDVVVVEEGSLHDASTYTTDPLEALARMYRDGGLTVLEGRPAIPLPLGRCVGGTTVVNSGTCVRTPEDVLARWQRDHGIPWAPALVEEFEAIERDLAVRPLPASAAGANAAPCRRGAEALGLANVPVHRNAGDVVRCGTCPTGCAIDAKQAMHVSELPRAVAAGARIRAGVRVTRILVRGGRAAGVEARIIPGAPESARGFGSASMRSASDSSRAAHSGGRIYSVHARAVVLAGGAIGTPELVLRHGLNGRIGRNLHVQPACWVGGRFDEEIRGWDGVMQSWHVDEWRRRGLFLEATFTPLPFGAHWLPGVGPEFVRRLADISRLAVIGVHLADTSEGRVRLRGRAARLRYRLTRSDAATLGFGIARAAEILFAAGAREAYPQVAGVDAIRPGQQKVLETGVTPARLRLEAFHPMGTAAMGVATDTSGELRELPGAYVADGSLLPTALGVNPMITIVAMARRVARGIADELS
ncbi:MAG TPA: GMC family oxidoreductase N-terminal domain-containing protein [Thermoleophilaceae bacterium]|nr:GMC family oxidoreductase N-terminal domain-containing protein [Thermoleophilaceae bacterium]